MSTLLQDIRYAVRTLLKRPGYTFIVIGMLGLGIAANTAIFSLFNGLFLRPLPFPEPERLVDFHERAPSWELEYAGNNYTDFHPWREENSTFEGMAVWEGAAYNLSLEGVAERIVGARVTHDMAEVLGIRPVLGRDIDPEDDVPGAPSVVLLGNELWRNRFGGDPDLVGTTLRLDGEIYEIIGILPEEALFVAEAEVWAPLRLDVYASPWSWYLNGVGRLKPDVTIQQAQEDLERIHKNQIEPRDTCR